MQRKRSVSSMTRGEQLAGTIFFFIYLAALPFAAGHIFRFVELLLGINLTSSLENALYYYVLLAVTIIIFHGFLAQTSSLLLDNLNGAAQTLALGLIGLYGLNELVYRASSLLTGSGVNLNDAVISAQSLIPQPTLLIVILAAPFVEEVLFRGLVFGGLRNNSRWIAYLISCLLFAAMHVWQATGTIPSVENLPLMSQSLIQYLVPGLVFAWAYERSGTLWTSVALHAAANALAVWMAG
ncbi:MAG: CPBP family intramembrane metalloprotease [Oscillibacter sp.]|nr:CPBP family intramembrane metalloprotease [Oscillibacter sp.]